MAFQIQDDIIDFTGTSKEIGKAVGQESLIETNIFRITSLIKSNNYLEN